MVVDSSAPPIKLSTKLFYGSGSVGYGVKDIAFRSFLLLYYNQIVGVRADLVSAAIFVALLFDAISDPVVGQWSDSLRTRLGRRHPFMFASAVPAAGSLLLLFMPPAGMNETQTFWYILVVGCAVRTFITFYEIPSSALAPELTSSYDERTSIASFRFFFGYLGGIVMAFTTLYVFLAPTAEYPVGQLNPDGYWKFAFYGALTMFIFIIVSALGTLHRVKYFTPPPKEPWPGMLGTLLQMKQTFSHRGFLALLVFGLLKYTAIGINSALTIYFGTYLWELNSAQLAILVLDALAGASIGLFLAPRLSAKFGKRNAALGLAVLAICFVAAPYVLRLTGLFFENGDPLLVPALFVFSALWNMCGFSSAALTHAMVGDVVEESQLKTGRRSEGLFYAANTFMQKATSGLGVFVAGLLVSSVGLTPNTDPSTVAPEIPRLLAMVFVPTVLVLYIGGAMFLLFYRIDRKSHEANVEQLRIRDRQSEYQTETLAGPAS